MHLVDNIKTIRNARGETQAEFAKHFTNVSLAMQKAYELGRTEPKNLYLTELATISGISEAKLIKGKLTIDDLAIIKSKVEKVHSTYLGILDSGHTTDEYDERLNSALLKAKEDLLAEKERVIQEKEKVLKKEEARRQEAEARLKKEEDRYDKLFIVLETNLKELYERTLDIMSAQHVGAAYQMFWIDRWAEKEAAGDNKKTEQLVKAYRKEVADKLMGKKEKSIP